MFKRSLFGRRALIGMIHLGALPGAPRSQQDSLHEIARQAIKEAQIYEDAGFDAVLIENMHDLPYLRGGVGPEIVAAMTMIATRIAAETEMLPLGVQVLAGANREALAVAHAAGCASFVRVEGFVFAHVADEGIHQSDAGELLRYRKMIDAEPVRIFADIKKKHSSHALTSDVDLVETARAAEFFGADAVIVTGTETGAPADPKEVAAVAEAVGIPVVVGSGVTAENIADYAAADALIVGSSVKEGGDWRRGVSAERVDALARVFYG